MVYQASGVYPLLSGRQAHCRVATLRMLANLILSLYRKLDSNVKKNIGAGIPPKLKSLGFLPED
ncbi:hypothetical protein C6503_09520 [Candidatus Poribacteria bacterium]|nr:MAG: hypothetical protein C6503_09520 [Candidatus Poribacteria bacterium]